MTAASITPGIRLCRQCVNPSTRPNMVFDAEGVCPVCRFEEEKRTGIIDWQARRAEIETIAAWGRANTKASYDCIVTVSGGKDSTKQALFARDELKMNPLLVSCVYPPEQLHERGAQNLANLISLGFDTLSIGLDPQVWKTLMRQGFFKFGNWARSTEMALYAIPIHAAIAYKIPLVFYGENPVLTIGERHGRVDGDASRLKLGNTIHGGPEPLFTDGITHFDTHFYFYPPDEDMEAAQLRMIYLGYYIPDWSGHQNAEFAIAHGLQIRSEPPEMTGDLWGFSGVDEDFRLVNQMLKYIKYGFGHVTDQVVEAINAGMMTREEGLELVKKYDGKCDRSYVAQYCRYLGIHEATFWEIAESYRGRDAWKKDDRGGWQLNLAESADRT
ncbi:MAG TPA: N-acetyl sugar amidotransferase [Vicinamibacterales bacterium]|nr:N-acetyl sugar amidotransferase [Vicinamibacterales bacterium]